MYWIISAILLVAICFMLGMVYEQTKTIKDLEKLLRDESYGEEKNEEKENSEKEENKRRAAAIEHCRLKTGVHRTAKSSTDAYGRAEGYGI